MRILLLCLAGLLNCTAAQAEQIIGGSLGYGFNEFKGVAADNNEGGDNIVYDIYYRYMWHDSIGIEAGYFGGETGLSSAFVGIFTGIENVEYEGARAALYGQYLLSERNRLYAKVGMSTNKLSYDIKRPFSHDEYRHVVERGQDLYTAAGWEFRFHSGFAINVEYQYIPVQALTAQNLNFGLSYQF
ncbi:porin family protein [Shewanella sp.]|nr:porin family protein [Shewanella sp.]